MIGNDGGRACGIPHPVILACQQQDISLEVFHLDAGGFTVRLGCLIQAGVVHGPEGGGKPQEATADGAHHDGGISGKRNIPRHFHEECGLRSDEESSPLKL